MLAAVTRARAKQSRVANEVETRVDRAEPEPRLDVPHQENHQTQLATDNDPDSANVNGITPLMRAAADGLVDFVQVILDRGADVNAKRNDGFSALMLAAFFGHSQVVRLLLKRGADVEAEARGTSAEMWADVRGFMGISYLLRETQEKKDPQEPAPVPTLLQEHPRFSRPVADERQVEVASEQIPQEDQDSKTVLETTPVIEFAVEEDKSYVEATVTAPRPRAAKTLPEIIDLPPVIAPEFHPASVFVARISSSRTNLAALIVVALVIGGIATFALPQLARSLTGGRTEVVTPTDLPAATVPVTQPEQAVSSQIETPTDPVELETAAPSKPAGGIASDSKSIESTPRSEATEAQLKPSVAKTMFRRTASARKHQTVSSAKAKQPELDPEPKPAPLSVEVSRSRTVLSPAPHATNESSGNQSSPLGITPNQSKTKVIRWP